MGQICRRAVAVLVGCSALLLGACGGPSVSGNRVMVIGDSISELSRDEITEAVAADGWNVSVHAKGGSTVTDWVTTASELAAFLRPDVAVVELGTNQKGDETEVRRAIDDVMRGLRAVPVVLWLNVQEDKLIPPKPSAVNSALDGAAGRWSNLHVLDFDDYFADRQEWQEDDALHPNQAGQIAIAAFIRDALRDIERPEPTP